MEHIIIFLQTVALITGVWIAVVTFHYHRRFRHPFLRYFFRYIIFFNLVVFFYLTTTYLCTNLLGFDFWDSHPLYVVLGTPVDLLIQVGMVWTLLHTVLALQKKTFSTIMKKTFMVCGVLIGFGFGFGIADFLRTGTVIWIIGTNSVTSVLVILIIFGALLKMFFRKDKKINSGQFRANRGFSSLYLSGYSLFFFGLIIPEPFNLLFASAVLLYLNLCPAFWYERFSTQLRLDSPAKTTHKTQVNMIVQRFHVSNREREILELILEGKSNKEIEGILYISINTVKNHIYSMYRKLGVNSRGQLMHLVLENSPETEDHWIAQDPDEEQI